MRQPWASLLALGVKRYETRSRPTRVRGRIAIHAGLALPNPYTNRLFVGPHAAAEVVQLSDGCAYLFNRGPSAVPGIGRWTPLPRGAVVATADVVDCVRTEDTGTPTLERALGDWTPGRWAWELADVRPLEEPVPARGKQGWWGWTPPEGVA